MRGSHLPLKRFLESKKLEAVHWVLPILTPPKETLDIRLPTGPAATLESTYSYQKNPRSIAVTCPPVFPRLASSPKESSQSLPRHHWFVVFRTLSPSSVLSPVTVFAVPWHLALPCHNPGKECFFWERLESSLQNLKFYRVYHAVNNGMWFII